LQVPFHHTTIQCLKFALQFSPMPFGTFKFLK
jgi:hypothetical protein